MAFYVDEEEVWKCPKHPLKRRRTGICPTCLRDRLITLCPECANTRPCNCCPVDSTSTSSSSSSSFSLFQYSRGGSTRHGNIDTLFHSQRNGIHNGKIDNLLQYSRDDSICHENTDNLIQYSRGDSSRHRNTDNLLEYSSGGSLRHGNTEKEVGHISTLIEREPKFRKSRSLAIPFLRSRSKYGLDQDFVEVEKKTPLAHVSRSKISFWSVFKVGKSKKCDLHDNGSNKSDGKEDYSRMMRSRSVAVGAGDGLSPASTKRRGWYFPSPMKVFRQSKVNKLQMHERSPMHRG